MTGNNILAHVYRATATTDEQTDTLFPEEVPPPKESGMTRRGMNGFSSSLAEQLSLSMMRARCSSTRVTTYTFPPAAGIESNGPTLKAKLFGWPCTTRRISW